jgi:HAE1 family hydrophobic/amphiphilic exporter-1
VGTAVFGGMLASTLLAVLVVPVFYVIVQGLIERFFPPQASLHIDDPEESGR